MLLKASACQWSRASLPRACGRDSGLAGDPDYGMTGGDRKIKKTPLSAAGWSPRHAKAAENRIYGVKNERTKRTTLGRRIDRGAVR